MSATDFTAVRPYCIACGNENVDPHLHLGGDVSDCGKPVDVYGYKCVECGARFHGYELQQTGEDIILWYSMADGSWGGCERDDLVIVPMDALTDDDHEALECAGSDSEVRDIVLDVMARLEATDGNE